MKALTWHGKNDIRCDTVPDPKIQDGRDAIIKVTACAICGSDLHLFDGVMPSMEKGDVLGHETMGEVVEVGSDNTALKVGDRVVVPFTISCGECFFCKKGFFSGCERSNPNHKMAEKLWGHSPAGLFGYSHMLGGYAGGQAEYLRVPYADVGPIKVPQGLSDEQVLFLSDIFPTGFMAADFCNLKGGETVAEAQAPVAAQELSKIFKGPVIAAGGFNPETAEASVVNGDASLIAFGRHFIANPDLPRRIEFGLPLNPYDRSTFYGYTARGYTDYPTLERATA